MIIDLQLTISWTYVRTNVLKFILSILNIFLNLRTTCTAKRINLVKTNF